MAVDKKPVTNIDHVAYPKRVRKMTNEQLRFVVKDATEAAEAMPSGHKAGYYADEINYCVSELHRRKLA